METLIEILKQEKLTCIAKQGDHLYKEHANGIKPILHFLDEGHLKQACLVDKVIGKAAAMMLVYGGVRAVHALVISSPALCFLQDHNIAVTYESCVPHIVNRTNTGICPMEACVMDTEDMEEAYRRIINKRKELANQNTK